MSAIGIYHQLERLQAERWLRLQPFLSTFELPC
jgi:hypothetical protein